MPESADAGAMEATARAYGEVRATERRFRIWTRVLSATLLVVILSFLGAIWGRAREAYAWEKFEEPVRAETERLGAAVRVRARAVVEEVAPVYARLGQERLETTLPLLRSHLEEEWSGLGASLRDRAAPAVEEMLDRLETRQRERLAARFPLLADPDAQEVFRERWEAMILRDHADVLDHLDRKYGHHLVRVQETLEGFRPNRFEALEEDRLTRHFVHLWLTLLDREVLQLDGDHAAPAAEGGDDGDR